MTTTDSKPKPLAIVGPTASGKSAVAMAVAQSRRADERPIHIVAVDAMQVYRDMNIGTAKPTTEDQKLVPHHCIDLVDSDQSFTVAEFKQAATAALRQINAANAQAVLVAGTGLYLTAVIDDLTLPGEYPQVRSSLEAEPDTAVLFGKLFELDPVAAKKIEPSNRRRIVRALEVCLGSGRAFSSFGPGTGAYPENGVVQIGLLWSRDRLAARVEQRVQQMMTDGFLDEVKKLHASAQGVSRTAAQALGYRELFAHLNGDMSLDEAVHETIVHTRQFAVRQERWFRRDPRINWCSVDEDPVGEIVPIIDGHLR